MSLAACDPCAGVAACRTTGRLDLSGQILDRITGQAVAGVAITVASHTGTQTSVSTVTDADGLWHLSAADAGVADASAVDVTVHAPDRAPYTVRNVATSGSGSGSPQYLGRWTASPTARVIVILVRRGEPLVHATVRFNQSQGIVVRHITETSVSNGAGGFQIDVEGDSLGSIVGSLTIEHSSLPAPVVVRNFRIALDYHYELPAPSALLDVGKQLTYSGVAVFRGTHLPQPGALVSFTRTGGIYLRTNTVSAVADETGRFVLPLETNEQGDVVSGDLLIRTPDNQSSTTFHDVRFEPYDGLTVRDAGRFVFGEGWAWTLEIWRHDRLVPVPGVRVVWKRTGGIALAPDSLDLRTDAGGRIDLAGSVRDTGTVVGQLLVVPSDGPTRLIPGIRLRTTNTDTSRFAGVYGFGPALRYAVEVLRTDGTPVSGATVEWAQTSGIVATPTAVRAVTDDKGRVALVFIPATDGEVVGTVRITPPAPWAPSTSFVFEGQRLATFESGELRLGLVYRLPPP